MEDPDTLLDKFRQPHCIEREERPDHMSLLVLEAHCRSEMDKYRRGEPSHDQYGVELFRRAVLLQDQDAWIALQHCFSGTVLSWLHRHPQKVEALRVESEGNYVAQTFARFWLATAHHQGLEFDSLAAALSYLRACLNGALLDTLRAYARSKVIPLPRSGNPEEPAVEETDEGQELWEVIGRLLPNEREQRLAHLLFHCGLKAREIVRHCPGEFSDVREVYQLRRTLLERLRRNADQIRWRLSSNEYRF